MSETTTTGETPRTWGSVTRRTWIDTGVVLVLALIGMVGFGSAFESIEYLYAGLGGLAVGAIAALLAYRFSLGALLTTGIAVVAYYLLGSPIAFFDKALFGVLPTLDTLAGLTVGAVYGWADIITLRAPVSLPDYVTAVPYVSGWLVALVSVTLALRWLPNRPRTVGRSSMLLLGALVLYLAGILLGTEVAFFAPVRGVAFAVIALLWLGWRRRPGGSASAVALAGSGAILRRKLGGTAAVVGAAAVIGVLLGSVIAPPVENRFVLREQVEPPFEPLAYPSPLAGFRKYTKDLVDTTLFTVEGLQSGQAIRLATMDTYDGVVWGVAGANQGSEGSGSFRLVGRTIPQPDIALSDSGAVLDVTVSGYNDVWIPNTGYTEKLEFTDAGGIETVENVRYNDATGTAALTSGVSEGTSYHLEALTQSLPDDESLKSVPVAAFAPASVSDTPDPVVAKANEVASSALAPIEKLRAIEQYLVTNGFLSHGTASDQVPSRAGHGADRMFDMVSLPQMVGDQEQYASLFALMARSFNYPVRVVMGFAPEAGADPSAPISVTGDDVTAWAEVAFEGVGWVPFYPTPDETDVPQNQVPKPQTEPQPQVRQPPRTDTEQDDLITAVEIDESDDEEDKLSVFPTWILITGISILVPLLILLIPLAIVAIIKGRRMRKRRAAAAGHDSAAGAWDELIDRYSELGYAVPARVTRPHVASGLQSQLTEPTQLADIADRTDAAVFSGQEIGKDDAELVWTEALAAVAVARASVSRGRRILSRYRVSAARRWAAKLAASADAQARTASSKPTKNSKKKK